MKPRLFVADDHISIRQTLRFLAERWRFEIVGEAADGAETVRECERLRPTILIMDLSMPGMRGVQSLREIRVRNLPVAALIYTGVMDAGSLMEAVAEEPEGFVLKEESLDVLRHAMKTVSSGGSCWSPLAEELRRKRAAARRRLLPLTQAEMTVLEFVAAGVTTAEIATKLHRAPDTVKHQRQSIMNKLGVHDAVALAALARQAGVVGPSGVDCARPERL